MTYQQNNGQRHHELQPFERQTELHTSTIGLNIMDDGTYMQCLTHQKVTIVLSNLGNIISNTLQFQLFKYEVKLYQ